ncbi:hypothetical protein [Cribrihabitans neustonicus]|uniref:hypothetical protein n=1 Tax=Cribrihabitans neustonicus TaxID=1429085 RepID=UPI003B5C41D9
MRVSLYREETALRRRLLLRLLRGFDFDAPRYQSEAVTDAVPKALLTPEFTRFDGHRGPALAAAPRRFGRGGTGRPGAPS